MNIEEREELIFELQGREGLYRKQPNNYKLLKVWQCYKNLEEILPDDLQEAIDRYLEARLKNESSKCSPSNFGRNLQHYFRVKNAEDPAAERKKIASEENVTADAIRKRIEKAKNNIRK